MEAHTVVAVGMGMILAPLVVVGLGILLWRRITNEHVWEPRPFQWTCWWCCSF